MKALNAKTFFLSALAAVLLFSSCSKDNDAVDAPAPPPPPTIEGTWVGKKGSAHLPPGTYYNFVINKDGTMTATDDPNIPNKSAGTWTLEGETFKGKYQHLIGNILLKYVVVAKYKAAEKRMDGNWGIGTDADAGAFYLDKQ